MENQSTFADAYKLKSGTIDKRLMRGQRRSIDWKGQRQDLLQKRRNLAPLQETFQNSSLANDSTLKRTKNGDAENKSLASKSKKEEGAADLKLRLSKWKQEKEAKKKLQALEKAKNKTFKWGGKLEHKDNKLFTGASGVKSNGAKRVPVESAKKPLPERKAAPVRNLKRKGEELESSVNKIHATESKRTLRKDCKAPVTAAKEVPAKAVPKAKTHPRELKTTRTPPTKRITRKTKAVASRLFAPTASTAAKKVNSTAKPEKIKVTEKVTAKPAQSAKKTKTIAQDLNKVTTTRGDTCFPEDFAFTAPSNLKSYSFNPLSPTSAENFFSNPDASTVSFFINSPEGRCSTPTPRSITQEADQEKNITSQSTPHFDFTVTVHQDKTNDKGTHKKTVDIATGNCPTEKEAENEDSLKESSAESCPSADEEDKTIIERTVSLTGTEDLKVTVTPKQSRVASDNNKVSNTPKSGVRKSRRLQQSSSDENSEAPVSQVSRTRRSTRNKSLVDNTTSESDTENLEVVKDSKKGAGKARRSSRRSVHKTQFSDISMTSICEESNETIATSQYEYEDSLIEGLVNDSLLRKSVSHFDDSVFVSQKCSTTLQSETLLCQSPAPIKDTTLTTASSESESENVTTSIIKVNESISTPKSVHIDSTKRLSKSADRPTCSATDDEFRTPGPPLSAQRRTRRRTVGSSTPTAARSPEEWIKILEKSPMIEMNRRTPKCKKSPGLSGHAIIQPNFDEVDEILNNSVHVEPDSTTSSDTDKTAGNATTDETSMEVDEPTSEEEKVVAKKVAEITMTDEGTHDVKYFRQLTQNQTDKLKSLNEQWNSYLSSNQHLTEEVQGCIRTVVGQSLLLMSQRFKQFIGLVDDCEFKRGEKETKCEDLQGFWDMIYFQVEDVEKKFEELTQRKDKNWVVQEKIVAKTVIKKKVTKSVKPAVKSKFAAFRATMLKQKEEKATSPLLSAIKTFDAGFFKVNSPVKKSPHYHCEGGTPKKSKIQVHQETNTCDKNTTSSDAVTMETEEMAEQANTCSDNTENKETCEIKITNTAEIEPSPSLPVSDSSSLKRQPLTPLSHSAKNLTPRRKSYAPTVPSPLLMDITPKPKTRRSLATNMNKQILSASDKVVVCPLTVMDSLLTPKSTKKATPKVTEDATPRRRSSRIRKSVCFTDTPTNNKPEPITEATESAESVDLSMYFQPTAITSVSSPSHDDSVNIPQDDSPFSKYLEPTKSAKSKAASPSKRRSLKRRPSDERRRSTRRSVHFTDSPKSTSTNMDTERLPHTPYNKDSLVAQPRVKVDDLLFTPPSKRRSSTTKSRPSLLFTPEQNDKENDVSVNTDNLMLFTP